VQIADNKIRLFFHTASLRGLCTPPCFITVLDGEGENAIQVHLISQCVDVFQKPLFAVAAGWVISASGASICVPEEMRYSRPIISEHGLHRSRSGSTSVAQRSQTFTADCHLYESIVFSSDLNSVLMFGGSGVPAYFSPLSALVLCVCKPYSNRQLRDRFRSC
jgi:hypothetical protein